MSYRKPGRPSFTAANVTIAKPQHPAQQQQATVTCSGLQRSLQKPTSGNASSECFNSLEER